MFYYIGQIAPYKWFNIIKSKTLQIKREQNKQKWNETKWNKTKQLDSKQNKQKTKQSIRKQTKTTNNSKQCCYPVSPTIPIQIIRPDSHAE